MDKATFPLKSHEIDRLREALGLLPDKIEGMPLVDIVRRKTFDRRSISLLKSDDHVEGQTDSFDLWQICRYRPVHGDYHRFGWALRSKVSGEYFVYAEAW